MRTSAATGRVRRSGISVPEAQHRSQHWHAQVVAAGWQRGQQVLLQQGLLAVLGPVSLLNAQQHQVRCSLWSLGHKHVLAALHLAAGTVHCEQPSNLVQVVGLAFLPGPSPLAHQL